MVETRSQPISSTDWSAFCAHFAPRVSEVREELGLAFETFASGFRNKILSELVAEIEKRLYESLNEPLESIFESCGTHTWDTIRRLLEHEMDLAVSAFSYEIARHELDQAMADNMMQNLKEYAMKLVERKARKEVRIVLIRMKDRFTSVFNQDKDSMPRVWTGKEDIKAITKEARSESLRLLSAMAALRFEERKDTIENVLFSILLDESINGGLEDPLASSTWEEIPLDKTLITPMECKTLWRQFKADTEYRICQANIIQESYRRRNNWSPPSWAILAVVVLGFNEFILLLRNPLYVLALLFVMFVLGIAIRVQKDVQKEFHKCIVCGLNSRFSTRFLNLIRRLAAEK